MPSLYLSVGIFKTQNYNTLSSDWRRLPAHDVDARDEPARGDLKTTPPSPHFKPDADQGPAPQLLLELGPELRAALAEEVRDDDVTLFKDILRFEEVGLDERVNRAVQGRPALLK